MRAVKRRLKHLQNMGGIIANEDISSEYDNNDFKTNSKMRITHAI